MYNILSTNVDLSGRAFVSTVEVEGKELPFFGVQWHPEKGLAEWDVKDGAPYEAISHSARAIETAQFLVNR
jgi:gamma-glutamyl hydrolase